MTCVPWRLNEGIAIPPTEFATFIPRLRFKGSLGLGAAGMQWANEPRRFCRPDLRNLKGTPPLAFPGLPLPIEAAV